MAGSRRDTEADLKERLPELWESPKAFDFFHALRVVESRYPDRVSASRASEAAATRCGEMLLEAAPPETLSAYRRRFGLTGRSGSAWFTLPDQSATSAWESALRHELNLHGGS